MFKLTLCATLETPLNGPPFAACVEVPPMFQEAFEPLRITDDRFLSVVTGEVMADDPVAVKTWQIRKDAADYLAKELANMLADAMAARDTQNGYRSDGRGDS